MVKFIPVNYQNYSYPPDIKPQIQQVSANLGTEILKNTTKLPFLYLHTDPSIAWDVYTGGNHKKKKREKIILSKILPEFPTIFKNFHSMLASGKPCVSILWYNKKWSKEFAGFLVRLTEGIDHERIKIIEIHSPFDTYCNSLEIFLERYAIFEEEVLKEFPSAIINIENQFNNDKKRKFGTFLLSNKNDIIKLSNLISKSNLKLKLVVDIPQLYSEHFQNKLLSESEIEDFLTPIRDKRDYISSVHIWGYNIKTLRSHDADLDIYFNGNQNVKYCFLQEICKLFNDGKKRYFVPEVNGTPKVQSIVNDLKNAGIEFVDHE